MGCHGLSKANTVGKNQKLRSYSIFLLFKLAIYQILLNAEPLTRDHLPPETTFVKNFRVVTVFTGEVHICNGVDQISACLEQGNAIDSQ